MSLWTSLEPASTTVEPGGSATVRLRLRNTGDVVDEYRFVPVGALSPWTTVEPQTLRLYPGTTGTVELTFAPPRTPDAAAGPHAYGVQIIPTEHPEATTVPEGNVTVTPFSEVRAELVPQTVKGRFRGRPKLAVDNFGNVKLTASISGSDNGDQLSYDIHPANVQIEPGRAAFIKTTLKPRQTIWAGAKETRPFTLAVQRSGAEPLPVQGTYEQPGMMPRWLGVLFSVLVALTIAIVMIWISYKPPVNTRAQDRTEEAAASSVPTPEPSAPKPPAASEPADEPTQQPGGDGDGNGAGGGGGGGDKPEPKPVDPFAGVLLRNGTTQKCVAPVEEQGKVDGETAQYPCDGAQDRQLWNLETVFEGKGPGNTDLVQIRNTMDGYCMDLPDQGAAAIRTGVKEAACTRKMDDNQLWWVEKRPNTNGLHWIHNYASNQLCLNVAGYADKGEDRADGTRITIFGCQDDGDLEWFLVKPDSQQ
ncbi:RICIN domain-containing protein [Streptomyces sp. RTd22]|uniref:RICIN domain-containing protein n=2 Tax=Streptomyces sp. RTd22 TaxID=1841249 RepID=UPI0007D8D62C|nr:RICIN domain-containing protein [Streptomyces sp. RTd22]